MPIPKHKLPRRIAIGGVIGAALLTAALVAAAEWRSLAEDGLHDPESPAIKLLQQPAEALSLLSPDGAGNMVNWVTALEEGELNPRTSLLESTKVQVLDLDLIMGKTGAMPQVRFSHDVHTAWLDCSNCHDKIFAKKAGKTPVNMLSILQGEFCGRCHGAVSFPLTECNRCHSVPWKR